MPSLLQDLKKLQFEFDEPGTDFKQNVEELLLLLRKTSENLRSLYTASGLEPFIILLLEVAHRPRISSTKMLSIDEWFIEILSQITGELKADTSFKFEISSDDWLSVIRIYLEIILDLIVDILVFSIGD